MRCPFCEQDVPKFHPNSHVIPEWMHKIAFGKNKAHYTYDPKQQSLKITQSGYKKSIICWTCEERFAKDDRFASLVLGKKPADSTVKNIADEKIGMVMTQHGDQPGIVLTLIDFKKMQNFVFSVMLRGHLAETGEESSLLGEKHYRKLRGMYFDDALLDEATYPILIYKINPNDRFRAVVSQPYRQRSTGNNLITFRGAGYEFHIVVQSHPVLNGIQGFRLTMRNGGSVVLQTLTCKPIHRLKRPWQR